MTEGFLDLYGALGDVNQAARALPSAAKYMTNFRAFFGDQFGREGANEELRATFKALEYSGYTQRGEGEMDKMMQEYIRITASTGGRVTPSEILTMLRRGKKATRGLSVEGLRNVSSLIEDYSAPTTGTALMSLYQNLVSGQVSNPAAAQFAKYGLIKPGGMVFSKAGLPKRIKPGGNILGGLLQEDPMKAATVLLEHLRKGGVDVNDDKKLAQEMSVMFPNRNAFSIMDSFITQRKQIEKEAARMGVSADTYQQSKLLSIDPELKKLAQLEEYNAQMENFKVAIGQNLLPVVTNLMGVLTPISQFFNEFPTVSKYASYLLLASKAGSGLLQTFSIYKQSSTLNFLRRAQTDAAALGTSMSAAERRAIGLKSKLSSAAGTFGFILKVSLYGIAIEKLFQLFSEMKAAREAWEYVSKVSGEYGTSLGKDITDSKTRKKDLEKKGLAVPDYLADSYSPKRLLEQAGTSIGALDKRDGFLHHFINSVGEFVLGKSVPAEFDKGNLKNILQSGSIDEGVKAFGGRTSELNNPEFMGAFRAKLLTRKDVTPEMSYRSDVILQKLNPAAFAQSHVETIKMVSALGVQTGETQKSIQAINQPAMDVATAFHYLHLPASLLPQDLNNTSAALRNFQVTLDSIHAAPPKPPGVTGNVFGLDGWKATGGRVRKGRNYMVGERGMELFTPQADGFITPNHALSADALRSDSRGLAISSALAANASSTSEKHYNITLNVTGDPKDAERLSSAIVEKLAAKINDIESTVHDRRHFDRMYSKASRNERQRS